MLTQASVAFDPLQNCYIQRRLKTARGEKTLKGFLLLFILMVLCLPITGEKEMPNLVGTWIMTSSERIIYGDAAKDFDLDTPGNLTWLNDSNSDKMLIIIEQKGRRFTGKLAARIKNGTPDAAENIVGVIGFDNATFYMVDEASYFDGSLPSPTEMELITREIDSRGMQAAIGKLTKKGAGISDREIQIKRTSAIKVASLMAKGLPFQATVPKAYGDLIEWMKAEGIPVAAGSPWGVTIYFDDPKAVSPSEVRFKVAMPVPEETKIGSEGKAAIEILPEREVASLMIYGAYENLEEVYGMLNAWITQKGYGFADAPREVMVRYNESMPSQDWITEIQFPIER
ncbi:MAG: GyrI-like domain-containing protein [Methanotrichaceae archaeon]|nr:GyrI-like domain-containing protein [Methanotrichaceae archaeon]